MTPLLFSFLALINAQALNLQEQAKNLPPQAPIIAEVERSITKWIYLLGDCESGNNEKALNPKDTDGTASKGKYQFKDTTFAWLSKKYNIKTTSIWNGDEQESILRRMIDDKDIDLTKQFPSCVKKIGLPPTHPDGS